MMMPKQQGLYGKFILRKADGSCIHPEAKYIVLRYDAANHKDGPASRHAIIAYARSIKSTNPAFADDLLKEIESEWLKYQQLTKDYKAMKLENKIEIITKSKFTHDLRLSKLVELLELDKTKDLVGLDFSIASLTDDCLTDFNFTNCIFRDADFTSSILVNTNFTRCDLRGAKFNCTSLTNTNFTQAKLARAVFNEAKFINTIFTDTYYKP